MGDNESGYFLHNLIIFGRVLRGLGLDVNPGRMIDLVQALDLIDINRREDFYHTARSLLVHRHADIPLFDRAFELFWRKPVERWEALDIVSLIKEKPAEPLVIPPPLTQAEVSAQNEGERDSAEMSERTVIEITKTYSDREVLRLKDFAELNAEEIESIRRLMQQLAIRLGVRRTRRRRPGNGHRIDLRRTLRKIYKHGGEVLVWARREPKYKPRPLVIIADISGSMERYTRLLLHFIYGLAHSLNQPVEAFVFSTRLTRITRQLKNRVIDRALGDVSQVVLDWAGGTRTGESLKDFNFIWGRRVLGRGAVVLIISDGWDRGDMDLLRREMSRLQRSCYRLIWLNPLLGSPVYEPLTRGMQTALPFTDDFLPVHNLASLEDLAGHLASLSRRR
ncbi:MAG TPA: VWA domain-containing protein [Anaerolineales bacterium]|nr:VWA domain-containing protein [Anaerolineales bacterium]